ncbi:recO [Acrasis kona]|uniref:RecO n=1 Tax=Acrasis kona TaxID=1008807 RepID=A0AAW2Z3W1_9EUKA
MIALVLFIVGIVPSLLVTYMICLCFFSQNTNKKPVVLRRVDKNYKKTDGEGVEDVHQISLNDPCYDQFNIEFDQQFGIIPWKGRVKARVGCGPVAWGMMFNLYGRMNKIQKFKTLFPDDLEGAIPQIVELGNIMQTVNGGPRNPKYDSGAGFTWPHKMQYADVYLKDTGYRMVLYYNTFGYKSPLPHNLPPNGRSIWDVAVDKVKNGVPILIGYKCNKILHYAISHGHRKNAQGQDELYANNGHNLIDFDNEWIRDPNLEQEKRNAPFYMVGYLEEITSH